MSRVARQRTCRLGRGLVPTLVLLTSVGFGLGCGADAPKPEGEKKDLSAAAATMLGGQGGLDEATRKRRDEDEARRRAAFEEKDKIRKAQQEAFDGAVKAYANVPDGAPRKLEDACTAMLEGYHQFKIKQHEGDDRALLNWYTEKPKALGDLRAKCMKLASADVANCQAQLLTQAPKGLLERELDLMKACMTGPAGGDAAPDAGATADAGAAGEGAG